MTKIQAPDEKELAPVKKRVTAAEEYAEGLEIKNDDDQKKATAALSELNKVGDQIKEKKDELTKPLNQVLRSIRSMFKPVEESHAKVTKVIKGKLATYHDEKKAEQDEKAKKLADRVDRGTMKPETAAKKIKDLDEPKKSVQTEEGQVQYVEVRDVSYTDLEKLKAEELKELADGGYLNWNRTKARKDALANKEVVGVEVFTKTQVRNVR